MAKQKVDDEVVIRQIKAKEAAIDRIAQAYIDAKAEYDAAFERTGNNTWAKSIEGDGFKKAKGKNATPEADSNLGGVRNFFLGNPQKTIYERTARTEFGWGERISSRLLPKAFGGLSTEQTKAMRNLQAAQAELKSAQIDLHKTMDSTLGTRTARLANDDARLLEAAKTIGGGFGAVKGVGRILGGVGSILLGGADNRFGELHIENGRPVLTGPKKDDRSIFDRFLNENSHVCGGGLRGLIATPFVFLGQLTGIGHPWAPGDAFITLFKGVESAVYLAADTVLTLAKAVYLPFNMAFNVVKTAGLLALKGVLAAETGILAVRGLFKGAADFSLKAHVEEGSLEAATKLDANNTKHKDMDESIKANPAALAASETAKTAMRATIDAANTAAAGKPVPLSDIDKIKINAAGRKAGREYLRSETIKDDPEANKAGDEAFTKVMTKTGLFGRSLHKNDDAKEAAAVKARQEAGQAVLDAKDAAIKKDPDANAVAKAAYKAKFKETRSTEEASKARREAGQAILSNKQASEVDHRSEGPLTELQQVEREIADKLAELDRLEAGNQSKPVKDFAGKQALLEQDLDILLKDRDNLALESENSPEIAPRSYDQPEAFEQDKSSTPPLPPVTPPTANDTASSTNPFDDFPETTQATASSTNPFDDFPETTQATASSTNPFDDFPETTQATASSTNPFDDFPETTQATASSTNPFDDFPETTQATASSTNPFDDFPETTPLSSPSSVTQARNALKNTSELEQISKGQDGGSPRGVADNLEQEEVDESQAPTRPQ